MTNQTQLEPHVYCVIIRRKNGTEFLAHARDGAAVYFVRREAYAFARELRTQRSRFRAHVAKARLVLLDERK